MLRTHKPQKQLFVGIGLVMAVLIFIITACNGDLSSPKNGTYTSEGAISQTWTFSGSDEITLSTVGGLVSTTGTYTIDGDNITITSTLWGTTTTQTNKITEITSTSFFIDGTKFVKQ